MSESKQPTLWHRLLGTLLTDLLTPVQITVQVEVPLLSNPPTADILLIRREGDRWTAEQRDRLPDGIRSRSASHILLEFKATESLNRKKLIQALAYGHFYQQTQGLRDRQMALVLLVARRPQTRTLQLFDFLATDHPGVYESQNPLLSHLTLISLGELANTSHNAFIRCFATQKTAREEAFAMLEDVGYALVEPPVANLLAGLRQIWLKGDGEMSEELTADNVKALGEKWFDLMLKVMPPEEVMRHYRPEQRIAGLRPRDIVRRFRPEELLTELSREEIEAFLQRQKEKEEAENK